MRPPAPPPQGRPAPRGHFEARFHYWFDNTITRGKAALVGWLALACLALVVPVSVLLVWTDHESPPSFGSRIAAVWHRTGQTLRLGGETGPPISVVLSVVLALIALFYVSTLVSLITTGITERILALDRGHALVLEHGHTVVLGWSEQIPTIVSELAAAHAQRRRGVIAILADRPKTEMEEEFRATIRFAGRTRLLCRHGRPTDPLALARVSPATAECVIVLPGDDAEAVKTLLSLTAAVGEEHPVHVVAAVRGERHLGAARLAGGVRATVLDTDGITARLLAQCARQPGLSLVYEELLNFAGHEFHTVRDPGLLGLTFHRIAALCPVSSAVGLARADGTVTLNPPGHTRFGQGDALITVAEDQDATYRTAVPLPYDPASIRAEDPAPDRPPERFLLLGWNRRAPRVAARLSRHAPPGSRVDVLAPEGTPVVAAVRDRADTSGRNLSVRHHPGDPTACEGTACLDLAGYDAVMVLAPDARTDSEDPDDPTLVTLLQLRARQRSRSPGEGAGARRVPVVTELADDRNRFISPLGPGADYVVSGRLIGLLMTQISQNPGLASVFRELLDAEGNALRIRPADAYVVTGREISFATVVESAARRGECAIGYRAPGRTGGVCLNPPKSLVRHWSPDDEIVVLGPET
ncbi:hypothetical protein BU197_19285 [Streptomyces sp. CBMA291]|nr:hypothetical protein [Streptomyces sp. CBMA291]MBD0712775.1 hypothetical protein [Streptomyces sp. CBMA370]